MDKNIPWPGPPCFIQPIEVSVVISSSSVIITGDSWDTGSSDSWEEAGDFTSDSSIGEARRRNETRTKTHQHCHSSHSSQAPLSRLTNVTVGSIKSLENIFGQGALFLDHIPASRHQTTAGLCGYY